MKKKEKEIPEWILYESILGVIVNYKYQKHDGCRCDQ